MFFKDSFLPQAQTIEVNIENEKLHGLKVLQLSDLHIDKRSSIKKLVHVVNTSNLLKVDIIVLTGDVIDCKVEYIKDKLEVLKHLKPKVYYISGNHDLYYGLGELRVLFDSFNFIDMDNSFLPIKYNGEFFYLAGLSDRFSKFFGIKREEKRIIEYLKDNKPSLFISHQPKDYKIALEAQSSLFLCGHTHGGQIFPFHLLVRLFQPFLSGLHYKNKMAIYVNKGLGTWGLKYRFLAPCELTMLQLISNKKRVE